MNQNRENNVPPNQPKGSCFHCGDPCLSPVSAIEFDGKEFCCNGCKQVYTLLNDTGMCDYYTLNNSPGNPQGGSPVDKQKFEYLDDDEIQKQLIDFDDGITSTARFVLPDMHCSSCIWLLEKLYRINPAIISSTVNFTSKEISVKFENRSFSLRKTAELLSSLGYEPRINLIDLERGRIRDSNRQLYIQIGIAGFAFVNIMLLSLPEYLSFENELGSNFKKFFGFLNILLALPVLLFSARSYFSSAWNGLRQRFINIDIPIVFGILALFGQSLYEIFSKTGSGYMDSFTGLIFLLLIGKLFQQKTYDSLSFDRDYKSYFPVSVHRQTNGGEEVIPLARLKTGDRIVVRHGEIIPADSILIKSTATIDYSFVTGESVPVEKHSGDRIYAGGILMGSMIKLDVIKELSQSYLTQLWNKDHKKEKKDIILITDSISRYFTIIILLIGFSSAAYWLTHDPARAVNAFTAVLIVACPCALALSAPFTLGNILRILSKNQLYLKNTHTIELLSHIDTIVFDKTGTLTYSGKADITFNPSDNEEELPGDIEFGYIKSLVNQSTHPLSKALFENISPGKISEIAYYKEYPGEGITGVINGIKISVGSAKFFNIDHPPENQNTVFVSINAKIRGYFELNNIYRKGFEKVLENLKKSYSIYLISGDNDREFRKLQSLFDDAPRFNQTPFDKLEFIRILQKKNKSVLMIGDGLNDAGALEFSDVGLAVSENKNAFTPASDGILDAAVFHRLHDYLRFSRQGMKVIYFSIVISLIYNFVGLSIAVSGYLSPLIAAVLMPVSSISVILTATGMTNLIAKKEKL